jgi:hypothetical protein
VIGDSAPQVRARLPGAGVVQEVEGHEDAPRQKARARVEERRADEDQRKKPMTDREARRWMDSDSGF